MPYTITFDGPDDVIQEGLLLFAKASGWSERIMVDDGNGENEVAHPESAEQYARRQLKSYVLERITKYQQSEQARLVKQQVRDVLKAKFDPVG
jgi:hypothetical protein